MGDRTVVLPPDTGTNALVRGLRGDLDLSQERFARLLGVSVRTIARWEGGGAKPDSEQHRRLCLLRRIVAFHLNADGNPEAVLTWLTSPQLFKCIPLDLLASSQAAKILRIE
jgi:transcriptional regulator with XRE-family HTH domain